MKRTAMKSRYRNTGPRPEVVELCLERAQYSCEPCGALTGDRRGVDWSVHHRLPRRMGGTKRAGVNSPAALLIVCGSGTTGCHGRIESFRAAAYERGLILRAHEDPLVVPVRLSIGLVLLTNDGAYEPVVA